MSSTALHIITALDLLSKSALTIGQIVDLLNKKTPVTAQDVDELIHANFDAIKKARDED